jgi:hypothetical protein
MKNVKKITALMLIMVFVLAFSTISASAATTKDKVVTGSSSFNSAWEKTATFKSGSTNIGKMVFGYDTTLTKEDYVWTMATECYSTPKIWRSGYDANYTSGSQKGKNTYAKHEITHKTYYVYYRIVFSVDYSNVTDTTVASHVK